MSEGDSLRAYEAATDELLEERKRERIQKLGESAPLGKSPGEVTEAFTTLSDLVSEEIGSGASVDRIRAFLEKYKKEIASFTLKFPPETDIAHAIFRKNNPGSF